MLTTRSPVLQSGSNRFSRSWLFGAVALRIYYFVASSDPRYANLCITFEIALQHYLRLLVSYQGVSCDGHCRDFFFIFTPGSQFLQFHPTNTLHISINLFYHLHLIHDLEKEFGLAHHLFIIIPVGGGEAECAPCAPALDSETSRTSSWVKRNGND